MCCVNVNMNEATNHTPTKCYSILLLHICWWLVINAATTDDYYCDKNQYGDCNDAPMVSHFDDNHADPFAAPAVERELFLLYDVNQSEGFNLRRDVYIRMAVFMNILRQRDGYQKATLVLPPFHRLYHWKSRERANDILFWNHFFNLDSLKGFTSVIDLWEYFDRVRTTTHGQSVPVNHVIQLKHFASMFESGKFEDKYNFGRCTDDELRKQHDNFHSVYTNFTIRNFYCVEYQGSASLLTDVLDDLQRT